MEVSCFIICFGEGWKFREVFRSLIFRIISFIIKLFFNLKVNFNVKCRFGIFVSLVFEYLFFVIRFGSFLYLIVGFGGIFSNFSWF